MERYADIVNVHAAAVNQSQSMDQRPYRSLDDNADVDGGVDDDKLMEQYGLTRKNAED